jgi:site-specific DNA-methyltransferase (adenine-specific)
LPNSIINVKSVRGNHSTEKPVELIKWILKYYSKEGDVVLDPTCGSGSSGVACIEMSRDYIGIEKDEEIFKVAKSRLKI